MIHGSIITYCTATDQQRIYHIGRSTAWTRYMSEHQLRYSVQLNKNNMRSVVQKWGGSVTVIRTQRDENYSRGCKCSNSKRNTELLKRKEAERGRRRRRRGGCFFWSSCLIQAGSVLAQGRLTTKTRRDKEALLGEKVARRLDNRNILSLRREMERGNMWKCLLQVLWIESPSTSHKPVSHVVLI